MKICYISSSAAPSRNASSLQIAKMCESFQKNGNKVTLIMPNTGNNKEDYYKFYNIKNNYKIIKLKFFNRFPIGFYYYLFGILSVLVSIRKKPKLIITRNFIVCAILVLLRKKNILEIHNSLDIEGRIVNFLFKNFRIFNSKKIIKIISITHNLKKFYIKKYNVDKKKIHVLNSGSSLEFKFKKNNKISKKMNIGYFGSVNKSRGIELIIKLSKLDKKNNYFIYGWSKKEINRLKSEAEITKNLFLFEYIPYSKITNEINKMDILLMPYTRKISVAGDVGDISNFTSPLKLFDYLVSCRIIIASNINILKEILIKNKNCIFVEDYLNPYAWKLKIKKIKSNKKKFNSIRNFMFKTKNFYSNIDRAKKFLEL